MTIRIYDTDSHAAEFAGVVLSCTPAACGYDIILDRTAFFPGGGGQEAEQGTLAGMSLISIYEEDQIVHHVVDKPLEVGATVHGAIDYERRFSNMQLHSGEHIVSGLLHSTYGVDNVGFHMGSAEVTLDINGVLTMEHLLEIEKRANEAIYKNLPVTVTYPSAAELADLNYRSKKELSGEVRIVTYEGLDCCACCAPHVQRTGEIGLIKILSAQKYKGGTRISMLSGRRALETVNVYQENVTQIGAMLSTKPEGTYSGVCKMKEELAAMHEQLITVQRQLIRLKAETVEPGAEPLVVFEDLADPNCAREYVNLLVERREGPVVLYLARGTGYQYIMATRNGSVRALGQQMNKALNGRGGGTDAMVQGTLQADREAIEAYWKE